MTPLPGVEIDEKGSSILDRRAGAGQGARAHLVVIGGGVIGLELGSVWRRLGAKVTCVEFLDQILPGFDDDVRKEANKIFKKQGIEFRLGTKVTGVKVKGGKATLTVEPAKGGAAETIEADAVLVSIGRRPEHRRPRRSTRRASQTNQRGQIETDHEFRTSVAGVWAIGDVIPGPMLAHKAEDEGIAVAENIAGPDRHREPRRDPSVVYTMPEIAGVGLTEEQAKEHGEVKVGKFPMLANSRAKTNHEPDGFVKVIADAKTDRVLGVWMIASVAGTMIAQAAQAMEFGATSEDIAYTCHAHPTHSRSAQGSGDGGDRASRSTSDAFTASMPKLPHRMDGLPARPGRDDRRRHPQRRGRDPDAARHFPAADDGRGARRRRTVVFSPVALHEPAMREIEALGAPRFIVVPNGFHRLDAGIWKQRYPDDESALPARRQEARRAGRAGRRDHATSSATTRSTSSLPTDVAGRRARC